MAYGQNVSSCDLLSNLATLKEMVYKTSLSYIQAQVFQKIIFSQLYLIPRK